MRHPTNERIALTGDAKRFKSQIKWRNYMSKNPTTTKKSVKTKNGLFMIKNSTYDALKLTATIILPAIDAFYITLSQIWGWGFGQQIDATIQAVIALINALLGLFIAKSSQVYKQGN